MRKIVLIHGRSQQGKPAAKLKQFWIEELLKGFETAGLAMPADVGYEFAYYGDLLIKEIKASKAARSDFRAKPRGAANDEEEAQFMFRFYSELLENSAVSPAEVIKARPGELAERGFENTRLVRWLAKALDNGGRLGDFSLKKATADVFYYLNDAAVRKAVNKKVMSKLNAETTVVIGHSLGSVVAYDVLVDPACAIKAAAFITLGSPLGLGAVKKELRPPLKHPGTIPGPWYNFFDSVDIVALRPLDKTNFNIWPEIINDGSIFNPTDNHHSIEGYLSQPNVARAIFASL
jgi:hypothetical protein